MIAARKWPRQRLIGPTEQSVYAGREFVGVVCQRGKAWFAYDIDHRALGRFVSRLEAFAAVLRKGGEQ
jgi:hypothetical protein